MRAAAPIVPHAIYAVGPPSPVFVRWGDNIARTPLRWGVTRDVRNIRPQARSWCWHETRNEVLGLWWTPSVEEARRLDDLLTNAIGRYAEWSLDSWFDIAIEPFRTWLIYFAEHERIPLVDEAEMDRRVAEDKAAEARKVAQQLRDAVTEREWRSAREARLGAKR